MNIRIQRVTGPESAKSVTTLFGSVTAPTAYDALLANVALPPGWHALNLKPNYAVYVAPGDNHCHNDAIIAMEVGAGAGIIASASIHSPGAGYALNDILAISAPPGGSPGSVVVTQLSPTRVKLYEIGTGYTSANNVPAGGGHGAGATVDITSSNIFLA